MNTLAFVLTTLGVINFHDAPGPCIGTSLSAVYISADQKTTVQGCYLPAPGYVRVVFLDGDVLEFKISDLRKPQKS